MEFVRIGAASVCTCGMWGVCVLGVGCGDAIGWKLSALFLVGFSRR